MSAYASNGKRISSQRHARRIRTCVCGKICRGNGGWSSHKRACKWAKRIRDAVHEKEQELEELRRAEPKP